MYRRRRSPAREPVFGFDSFLDVVANVIGIIIRLILVTWVGARAYSAVNHEWIDEAPAAALPSPKASDDPLHPEVARAEHELAEARARLLEQLRQLQLAKEK